MNSCSEVGVSCGWDEAIRKSRMRGRGEVEVEEGKRPKKRGYLGERDLTVGSVGENDKRHGRKPASRRPFCRSTRAYIYIYTYRPITAVRGPLPPLTPFFHLATRKKSERVKQGVLVAFHLIQGTARGEEGKEERADY